MGNVIYILLKYWKKHKKNAIHLIFAGVLMVVILVVAFLNYRTTFNRKLHQQYDLEGAYDVMIPMPSNELIHNITDGKAVDLSTLYVLGKMDINKRSYNYGYYDDKSNLLHIPMESGNMPANQNEIAIERTVLTEWKWAGTLGGSYRGILLLRSTCNKQHSIISRRQ